jgi:ubiquinone/menaquinone biosynthesis C-methylase UbiE
MEGLKINQKTFGDYYDKPDWWFKIRYDTQYKKNTCLQILKKNDTKPIKNKILEIGFGCGETLLSFHKSELHGVEISKSAIDFVMKRAQKKKIKNIHLQINTKNFLPYPDNSFDLVIASHVIEHVEDPSTFADEINRVLSTNGYCLLLIPINEKYEDPNHLRKYTTNSLISFLREHNFSIIDYFENEFFFHLVESFYNKKLNIKWKIIGPIIVLIFNIPLSFLPYRAIIALENIFKWKNYLPRQSAILINKRKKI